LPPWVKVVRSKSARSSSAIGSVKHLGAARPPDPDAGGGDGEADG
jgi:hypothetical protein